MQEELVKVLTLSNCHLKTISLVHAGLKPDFFHKMQVYLQTQSSKSSRSFLPQLKHMNVSKSSIEDRGLIMFANLYKDYGASSSSPSPMASLILSKCSLTSKSVNNLLSAITFPSLAHLDLSYNYLKDDPSVSLYGLPYFFFVYFIGIF